MRGLILTGLALSSLSACIFIPVVVPAPPAAGTQYICADGAKISALYATDGEQATVALSFDNQTLTLIEEPTDSGARYGWPSDGTNYVWLVQGDEATLLLDYGTSTGPAVLVHSACLRQN